MLRTLATALLVLAALPGCVERMMTISTVPEGADVYLDGTPVGESPVTVPFTDYGTREIVCRRMGYETVRALEVMEPPYFQEFPYDLYYETLTADEYADHRRYRYVLAPNTPEDTGLDVVERKMKEAAELRQR